MMIKKPAVLFFLTFALLVYHLPPAKAQSGQLKTRRIEKKMAGKKRKGLKVARIKQPGAVTKAQKEQEKKQRKSKKEYDKAIKENQKRHFAIQTDEVKERMKKDQKDIRQRDRERKRADRVAGRKKGSARKKYKRR